ncbi:MAG TPA: TIGR02281 family clan AA aspartic protease [Pararhizobium sp.]|nr:TIGR02281 family clan AA aspartic protease [Pararhizobium sp.]
MSRYIVLLVLFVGLAGIVPHYFEAYSGHHSSEPAHNASPEPASAPAAPTLPEASYLGGGRRASLQPNAEGHFTGTFRINGRAIDGMIDTGATDVAMNESTARDLGVSLPPSAFVYTVRTANGTTKAARTTLDSVEVGQIRIDDVAALVLQDRALSEMLIGMSFLGKLRSYQVRNGVLDLRN